MPDGRATLMVLALGFQAGAVVLFIP
jgi:hypothetical protein